MHIITDNLNEQIQNLIKQRIFNKEYKTGEQINTKEIAAEHGISTMPVRDALQELTLSGLVINRERVGFFVKIFTLDEVKDIIAVRRMYEVFNLDSQFDVLNREKLTQIYHTLSQNEQVSNKTLTQEDYRIKLDYEIHKSFIAASHNPFLIQQYEKMLDMFVLFSYKDNTRYENANKEHLLLLENILQYNKEGAISTLNTHLDLTQEEILAAMVSENKTYSVVPRKKRKIKEI